MGGAFLKGSEIMAIMRIRDEDGNIYEVPVVKGDKGDPGYTPQKGIDYFDGADGYTPQKNVDYFDGHTPVKGEDYFTEEDVAGFLAEVTPEKIGAAPSGYGLGVATYTDANTPNIRRVEDLDVATKCGWFAFAPFETGGAATLNNISILHGILCVSSYVEDRLCQELYAPQQNVKLIRWNYNGSWSPWECDNPPMALGVEYRTAERWNNKVVYTKLVNYNGMPGATTYAAAHGCAATNILRYCAVNETLGIPIPNSTTSIAVDKTNISLTTNTLDVKGNIARVQIWYTKD